MAAQIPPKQLLERVLFAIDESGWNALVLSEKKPFQLRVFRGDEKGFTLRVYIWSCTHGGGRARAQDEYRVQLTGVVPNPAPGEVTVLLGWHEGYRVFVAFDMQKHSGQASNSPSIQIKENTLQNAHSKAFSLYARANGEIAVAFRPEFLVDYALSSKELHQSGAAQKDLALLNDLESLGEEAIEATVTETKRKLVISQITRKYRATDFQRRVLAAYTHQCAMCGVQLQLVDAAHIIPVAVSTSTDETKNGIALCKTHHAAFDRNLVSFDEAYKIEISNAQFDRLTTLNLTGGFAGFKKNLFTAIRLPSDRRDYPPPQYISESRKVRNWY